MRNYVYLVLAFVVFVIAFNSIQGSRKDEFNIRKLNVETEECQKHGGYLYIEPRKENVCVPKRKPESGK